MLFNKVVESLVHYFIDVRELDEGSSLRAHKNGNLMILCCKACCRRRYSVAVSLFSTFERPKCVFNNSTDWKQPQGTEMFENNVYLDPKRLVGSLLLPYSVLLLSSKLGGFSSGIITRGPFSAGHDLYFSWRLVPLWYNIGLPDLAIAFWPARQRNDRPKICVSVMTHG